jgi:hypothetical protein
MFEYRGIMSYFNCNMFILTCEFLQFSKSVKAAWLFGVIN